MNLIQAAAIMDPNLALRVFALAGKLGDVTFAEWIELSSTVLNKEKARNVSEEYRIRHADGVAREVVNHLCDAAVTHEERALAVKQLLDCDMIDPWVDSDRPKLHLLYRIVTDANTVSRCAEARELVKAAMSKGGVIRSDRGTHLLVDARNRAAKYAATFAEWAMVASWCEYQDEQWRNIMDRMEAICGVEVDWWTAFYRESVRINTDKERSERALNKLAELV